MSFDMFNEFSKWTIWSKRNLIEGIKFPGVYCLAISKVGIDNTEFNWTKDIKYIGMTNSLSGLRGRLRQFDNTIKGKNGHGGADRFLYKHQDYENLVNHLYVSIRYFKCNVKSNKPEDYLIMGEVAKLEYVCLAEYLKKYEKLPEFNDKSNSPKYSSTYGRD